MKIWGWVGIRTSLLAFFLLQKVAFSVEEPAILDSRGGLGLQKTLAIEPEWFKLLQSLVETNSGTENPAGLDAVRQILIPKFEKLGFRAKVFDVGEHHKIVSLDGSSEKPVLLLVGHVDTVFPPGSLGQKFTEGEGRLFGPGVIDMKGGNVLMLNVLKNLKKAGADLNKIRIVVNDDEEIGSRYSKRKLLELAAGIPVALVFEPGLPRMTFVTSHSGVQWLELKVKGKAAHAGLEHQKGLNACAELSEKISQLHRLTDYQRGLTLNIGVIQGGIKPNVVCGEASAKLDIRYRNKSDLKEIMKKISEITGKSTIKNSLLGISPAAELKSIGEVESLSPDSSALLFQLAREVALRKHHEVNAQHVGYGSDGGPLSQTGMAVLVGLGPSGGGMHTDQEFMDLESYHQRLEFSQDLIQSILNGEMGGKLEAKSKGRPKVKF